MGILAVFNLKSYLYIYVKEFEIAYKNIYSKKIKIQKSKLVN